MARQIIQLALCKLGLFTHFKLKIIFNVSFPLSSKNLACWTCGQNTFSYGPSFSGESASQMLSVLSRVQLFVTPWTVTHQALLSMGFPRQEYWIRFPFPSLGDLPCSGIESVSPALAGKFFTTEPPGKPLSFQFYCLSTTDKFMQSSQRLQMTRISG